MRSEQKPTLTYADLEDLNPGAASNEVFRKRADDLFRFTKEWHDLSQELWDALSFEKKFELVAEMAQAEAAEQATTMTNMAGALQACVDQIEQMKGMFDDSDGTIGDALQVANEALDGYHASTEAAGSRKPVSLTPRMKG